MLAPTRELAAQIVGEIRGIAHARALRVTAVYGGASLVKQAKDAAVSHFLVATPGRSPRVLRTARRCSPPPSTAKPGDSPNDTRTTL